MEYWSIGVLEYWSIGVLEYWSIGVLEYWSPLQLLWPPPDALPLMSFSYGSRTPNVERFALAG